MIEVSELKREAQGRWRGIVEHLGIDVGNGKHGPCPMCGGKDRFRYDDKDGTGSYICNQCGAGDSIAIIQKCIGLSFNEALLRVNELLGNVEIKNSINQKPEYNIREMLNKIWKSSLVLQKNDQCMNYLMHRGLFLKPQNIRFCPKCYESDSKNHLPAMVGLVSDTLGVPVAIHRTYLDGNNKANINCPKKITPAVKSLHGCSVKLFQVTDVVGVAEGIETAIAATQLWNIPTWSVINTSIMESFEPPEGVRKLVIFGDNDSNFAGQKSAYSLAKKMLDRDCIVEVQIPEFVGDWNDEVIRLKKSQS